MDFNIVSLWTQTSVPGKAVIVILALMGIYMIAISVERYLVFTKARSRSLEFVFSLQQKLRDRDIKGALSLSQLKPQSPIALVIEAALKEYTEGLVALKHQGPEDLGDFDILDAVNRSLDRVKEREVADLKKELRGMEGLRVRALYAELGLQHGVTWKGRNYDRQNWETSDAINRSLSAANASLKPRWPTCCCAWAILR